MSTDGMLVVFGVLIVIACIPLVFVGVVQWLRRRRSRRYTLKARESFYGGTFLEPSIDFDELERRP